MMKKQPTKTWHLKNILGQRFGRLIVTERAGSSVENKAMWKCICDCGGSIITTGKTLRRGEAKSCGCLKRESKPALRHGHSIGKETPTYRTWSKMIWRCNTKTGKSWNLYGQRGIKVCDRWKLFENFLADMGERPDGMTLDRFPDQNGNYEPKNCRWATPKQQAQNRRGNIFVEYQGERLVIAEACRRANIRRGLVMRRIEIGWNIQLAFDTPVLTSGRPKLPGLILRREVEASLL